MAKEYHTAQQTADLFGVTLQVVYSWIKQGILPATMNAGKWQISNSDIDAAIKNLQKHGFYYSKEPID